MNQTEAKPTRNDRLEDFGDVLTIAEAGRVMRLGRNSAYAAAASGELPTVRIGRKLLVPRQALAKMLEAAGPSLGHGTDAG